jgi:hypothetical protein
MKYRIKNYNGDSLTVSSKVELFKIFDQYNNYKKRCYPTISNIKLHFVNNFVLSINEGNFLIKIEEHSFNASLFVKRYDPYQRKTYINGYFILFDSYGNKVDLDIIVDEYNQSRSICEYASKPMKCNGYDRSTAKWRKRSNQRWGDKSPTHNSFGKEYRDSFYAKEYNVKIRQKRFQEIKDFHAFDYDYVEYRHTEKSWKSKKQSKQWK